MPCRLQNKVIRLEARVKPDCSCAAGVAGVNVVIRGKVSRQDFTKMVRTSREMVSRVMKHIKDRDFVETCSEGSVVANKLLNSLDQGSMSLSAVS